MLGHDTLLDAAADAVALPGCDGVEVSLTRRDGATTRFARSRVHQSTARLDGEGRVRVVVDGRVGVSATNDLTRDGLLVAAERARAAALLVPADPAFPGLAPSGQAYAGASRVDEATAGCSAGVRAELVAAALAELPPGVEASGTVSTAVVERGVVTSTGVAVYDATTSAGATVLAQAEDSSGWAEHGAGAVGDLDVAGLGRRAGEKAVLGRAPREVPPGRYPVVLEGLAVADLVQWLGWIAFPGKAVEEGRSALTGRLGERVCSEAVTLVDHAAHPALPGRAFDHEGTPTAPLVLLDAGVATAVTHDRATAAKAGTTSTGHAWPAPNPAGGMAAHLVMTPGTASLDELVGGLERGLLVTRFHYTNVVHPTHTTITGMTRDGTFLVEDGRVVGGVRNLRFTQSALEALSSVEAVGCDVGVLVDPYPGSASAPALRLSGFAFTSATAF
jgi:PmbA protein